MVDFSIKTYISLIEALSKQGFSFITFSSFIKNADKRTIILRHDVDLLPENSLRFARIQAAMGIRGTYYFRVVSQSFNEKIIKEIHSMGHEVGYHYEDVSLAAVRLRAQGTGHRARGSGQEEELVKIAIDSFRKNLERLRKFVPVKTICMHGSPMSMWDSRLLWKYYDYRDFGITGEPYFDIDFDEVLYLTDTGRRWDGDSFNIRDKAQGSELRAQGKSNRLPITVPIAIGNRVPFPEFHTTFDIISAVKEGKLPDRIMMTFHPQRWTDKPLPWVKELVWQNVKNVGKFFLVKIR